MTSIIPGITSRKAGKVLVVNVDPEVLRILEVNLIHANFELTSAENGADMLSKIDTEKPDVILLDPDLPDIDGIEICQQLKESPRTSNIPIIAISAKSRRKTRGAEAFNYYITKPFDPKEVVALVKGYLKQKGRAENRNPLTGLPNKIQVNNELTELIEQKKTFAAIYIAMDDFGTFNKTYGYAQGDCAIRLLADISSEAVRLSGNPDDLVGYLGGDKFTVITTPWKARTLYRRINADFNRRIKALYIDENLQQNPDADESPLAMGKQSPRISLRIAVITNQKRTFHHHLEVSEAAAEQMNYLRRLPGNKSAFDIQDSIEPTLATGRRGTPYPRRDELKATHGMLAWIAFLIDELNPPINIISNTLDSVESRVTRNIALKQGDGFKTIRDNINQLAQAVEGLTHLAGIEEYTVETVFEEIDIGNTLDWIIGYVRKLAERRGIGIDIEKADKIGRLMIDRRALTQGLLYLIRSEIQSGPPGSRLHISTAEMNDEFINIEISNPDHYIPRPALDMLLLGQTEGAPRHAPGSELYPASLLLQEMDGRLKIVSERGKGITYTAIIPKKWPNWIQEVSALQLATEISRKEARAELKNIHNMLLSLAEQAPSEMKDSLEKISSKVQELGVLCNRSLFLADDLNRRLETQQDRLLQQEMEQLATTEAVVAISREIARSMQLPPIFDIDSAKKVAKYALAMAQEFELSESECRTLHHAALLKDLGLILSVHDMVEQKFVPTLESAMAVRASFNLVWKALSSVPFLSSALVSIQYQHERYDGTGSYFGAKGASIPLGARILAVADTFEAMTSSLSPQGKSAPKQAVEKIMEDSGRRFDPDVVNAFLSVWKRKELHPALSEP